MAQKTEFIPGIGEVLLSKRRGARNIRISVTPGGRVRVGLPSWAPYSAGISFAKSKMGWIQRQLILYQPPLLKDGVLVGKYHRVEYVFLPTAKKNSVRVTADKIIMTSTYPIENPSLQSSLLAACERALRQESTQLLPQRLEQLAQRQGYSYQEVKIRKLTSRWGSCSNAKSIRLSYFLIQLPWHLIDYVLIHELVHTQHLSHDKAFWRAFTEALPDAKKLQKEIRAYSPRILI